MNHTEHTPKNRTAQTGLFATLANLLHGRGSGAPADPKPSRRGLGAPAGALLSGALAVLCINLALPAAASARFVRPFLHQTTGTCQNAGETPPSCSGFAAFPPEGPEALAIDAEDELWAARGTNPALLDRFQPSGAFEQALELSGAEERAAQLAIDPASGAFYISSNTNGDVEIFSHAGALQHTIPQSKLGSRNPETLAFDPSSGSLYVVNNTTEPETLFKFDAAGNEASFSGSAGYISGNEITGAPGANKLRGTIGNNALAVDPTSGDIYVFTDSYEVEPGNIFSRQPAILEYAPSGEFIHAITGEGVPLPPGSEHGGFGGSIAGLAVDPSNGDLLLSVIYNIGQLNRGAVDEFDSTGHFLGQITEAAGLPLQDAEALALDSTGHLYVGSPEIGSSGIPGAIDAYGPGGFVPNLRLDAAGGRTQTTAVLSGAVNPESPLTPNPSEYNVADCHFEYTTEAKWRVEGFSGAEAKACESPDAAEIPTTNAFTPVHAALEGLESGTTYRYRLAATLNGALSGGPQHTATLAFTAPHAPEVSATAANQITSTFADLLATVNPLGADTTYRFEYLTQAAYEADGHSFGTGTTSVPTPPADLGPGGPTGSSQEAVLQHLGGLQPATTYRFRLTAENEVGPTTGEEVTFTTQPPVSPGLPDNRAYELLTPPDKEGAEDLFRLEPAFETDHERGLASESGDQVLLDTRAAFGPFPASAANVYRFSRQLTPGGPQPARWEYNSLTSPGLGVQSIASAEAYDPADFSRLAFIDNVGAFEGATGIVPTALLGPPGGPYATLHTEPGQGGQSGSEGEFTKILGGSRDLGHLVFETTDHSLAPAAAGLDPGAAALYEWEAPGQGECTVLSPGFDQASGGCFSLLNVNTNGQLLGKCGAGLGAARGTSGGAYRAVSADGSHVFLTAPAPWDGTFGRGRGIEGAEGCNDINDTVNHPQLYLRSGGETFKVSEPQPLSELNKEKGKFTATYVGAAAEGSRVFFRSEAWLTADHPAAHDPELYEWRLPGVPGSTVPGSAGPCEEASPDWVPASQGCLVRVSAAPLPAHLSNVLAVAADGSAVYFTAFAKLAEGGEDHPVPAGISSTPDSPGPINLYRYATAIATPTFVATVDNSDRAGNGDCSVEVVPCPTREFAATPDGRFFLFGSTAQLTLEAHNASTHCQIYKSQRLPGDPCAELYRYDAQAAEHNEPPILCVSCDPSGAPPSSNALFTQSAAHGVSYGPPRGISNDGSYVFFDTADSLVPQDSNGTWDVYEWHGGKISLLSSGTDSSPSLFLDASPDGHNVFFGTHARLVAQDTDTKGDLYDARICTESEPCISAPPGKEGLCEGDACSHPVPAPNHPTPGTSILDGPENEHPVNRKHHKHHKKHHRKKHHKRSHKRANSHRRASR